MLRRQIELLRKQGLTCFLRQRIGFYLFNQTYHSAFAAGYRDCSRPAISHRLSPDAADARRAAHAGHSQRHDRGACAGGKQQRRMEPRPARSEFSVHDAPRNGGHAHSLQSKGEGIGRAARQGVSLMANTRDEAGNSFHIHVSILETPGTCFNRLSHGSHGVPCGSKFFSPVFGRAINIHPALPVFAPTINSYKRDQPGSWAPTRMAWAIDNRTVGSRGGRRQVVAALKIGCREPMPILISLSLRGWPPACRREGKLDAATKRRQRLRGYETARLPGSADAADLFESFPVRPRRCWNPVVDFYTLMRALKPRPSTCGYDGRRRVILNGI